MSTGSRWNPNNTLGIAGAARIDTADLRRTFVKKR